MVCAFIDVHRVTGFLGVGCLKAVCHLLGLAGPNGWAYGAQQIIWHRHSSL